MESAAKALEMAFSVFVFVMALGVTITNFSRARQASETIIMAADSTTYYDYATYDETSGTFKYQNGEAYSYTKSGNRIVGFETIIPTVYKYSKENYTVEFKKGVYDSTTGEYTVNGPREIYKTETNSNNWSNNYENDYNANPKSKSIYKFDINEEGNRHEPWIGNPTQIKKHLDAIFGGTTYHLPQYSSVDTSHDLNYSQSILNINRNNGKRFIEEIGRVQSTTSGMVGNNTTSKTVITYILID